MKMAIAKEEQEVHAHREKGGGVRLMSWLAGDTPTLRSDILRQYV